MIPRLTWAVALTIVPILAHATTTRGDELLLLRNGYALRGQVSRVGDRYVVRIASNSETRIPISAVEMRCRDFADAYQQKAAAIGRERTGERIELIRWCLRHEMYDQANEQLRLLERDDPRSPHLPQLQQRVAMLSKLSVPQPAAPPVPLLLKSDELDLLMRELPDNSVEQFTTMVQPLLLNRCSTGGCHGPGTENTFRLIRPRFGRELERPFTQRNLHAVLKLIEGQDSSNSSFALALRQPHGPGGSADAKLTNSQIEQVLLWMKRLGNRPSAERAVTISAPPPTLKQATTPRTGKWGPVSSGQGSAGPSQGITETREDNGTPKRDRNAFGRTTDPYDPEVFNRRYHADARKPPMPTRPSQQVRPQGYPHAPDFNSPNRRR